jgi:hypothetical protein
MVRRKPSSLDNDLSESTSIIPCTASDGSPIEISSLSISSLDSFPNCIMLILEMCNTVYQQKYANKGQAKFKDDKPVYS